ncbi:cell division protein FtsK [Plantactinospora sp. S1510]|uniref:Cell division protein FtsK n=1 Tax=Plantactinospora alkalitolerans TaxID=2789879 RepID=A0ABS0GT02_9ACTN|nr:cell division protein FtsK [Plantactinospora alkalitolerans]MBF9129313.1 cell division protein FtsK [Plantactinospora alkalitolerans]
MASNPEERFDWEAAEADLNRSADAAGTHFDVALDEAPQPGGALVDVPPSGSDGRRPIVPTSLRGWANLRASVRYAAGLTAYRVGYHALRSPWYAVQAGFWSSVGLFRLLGRQLRWWWLSEQYGLRQAAADAKDAHLWLKLHREVKATRAWRGTVLAAELAALGIGGPVLWPLAPWWAKTAAAVVGVSYLAHIGRPADRRIISPATVAGRFRRVNPDIILRAYYAAGLGHPDRPNQQITFGSTMARDASGTGSQVLIDLPFNGKTWEDVLKAKPAIAAGMDVSVNQVFVTRDPSSHRRHLLFVADRDPLAVAAGKTPLLDGKVRDIWTEAPFGLDERGRKVSLALMWISVLIGAQPRKGKTFATRLLALYAALDPYVTLLVADGKMSADWDKFRLVAHRYVCGAVPNSRDNDPIPHLLDMLREIKRHIEQVNDFLAKLPTSECPEGKITRELSRKYPQLRVWLLVMEEFQTYFETDDQDVNKEIAGLLSFIMAVGPSAGVIILSSSQKPSGVGAGDVARLFNRYRDNHGVRFALKCGNRVVSEAILGGDAYAEGFDASTLPNGVPYRGVGILYGASDDTATVRTYLADHTDAEKILTAARKHRERAGTLTGDAAGESVAREVRDVLADVRAVFHPGEPGLHWTTIAARMAEQMPEHYADLTGDAASALLREHVPSVSVKVRGTVNRGARLKDLNDAITRRKSA